MITLSWYLLKVIICSGILCGFYFLALRNKAFHRWNRFYILAAIIISLLAPVIKINIFQNDSEKGTVVQVLQTIGYGDEAVIEYSRNNQFHLSTETLGELAYGLVSAIFLALFFVSLYKIKRLRKKYPETKIEDVSFINTNAKGTPFSFFNSIFWNNAIDLHSRAGQQIFNHEIAHVKEKHSYDKIFMNIVLIFFWINPFFWLMRKELYMIHEFIADKEALEDSDVSAFAEMVLQSVYPGQKFSLNNPFFYSPLKRRIMMLAKNKNPKVSYISRLLVLPLAALVFFAFTLKIKHTGNNFYQGKTITVIIDAGHGGTDLGAFSKEGLKEKDITLSLAKKIEALNSNDHIKIILSRDDDQTIPVKDRVVFAKNNNADLFISIHVNASVNEQLNGFSVLVAKNYNEQDELLGSALINELKKTYKTEDKIGERDRGVWVIHHNVCPAVIVECGYMTNANDAAFISKMDDQEQIAKNILDAINIYASSKQNSTSKTVNLPDSIPNAINQSISISGPVNNPPALIYINGKESSNDEMKSISPKNINAINVLKGESAIKKYGQKGKDGVIEITTRNAHEGYTIIPDSFHIDDSSAKPLSGNLQLRGKVFYTNSNIPDGVLIFADGKKITRHEMKEIPPNTIQSINVLKGETALKKYGQKAKDGAVEITTKNNIPENAVITIDGKKSNREELNKIEPANIESITILKDKSATKKYGAAGTEGAIEVITKKNSPFLTLIDTIPDKIFTKVENEASFPGGKQAWVKYISKAVQDSISNFTKDDYGTCLIRFIVNTDGRVSDIIATTMKGTELAKVSINAIKNGPKWIPASQNGEKVAAYRLQPVTLTNPQEKMPPTKATESKQSGQVNTANEPKAIFTTLEQPASFPGGQSAWLKYISREINKNGNALTVNKNNVGTCKVKFVVTTNGKVSEVQATTMAGTELAKVAVNAIKNGPDWIPGKQNGHAVNSYVIQPVTFYLGDQSVDVKGTTYKVISKDSLPH